VAIIGTERHAAVIRGTIIEAIRGHQRSSEVIRGHQWPSEVIRGTIIWINIGNQTLRFSLAVRGGPT
jgi:hypothetical protein